MNRGGDAASRLMAHPTQDVHEARLPPHHLRRRLRPAAALRPGTRGSPGPPPLGTCSSSGGMEGGGGTYREGWEGGHPPTNSPKQQATNIQPRRSPLTAVLLPAPATSPSAGPRSPWARCRPGKRPCGGVVPHCAPARCAVPAAASPPPPAAPPPAATGNEVGRVPCQGMAERASSCVCIPSSRGISHRICTLAALSASVSDAYKDATSPRASTISLHPCSRYARQQLIKWHLKHTAHPNSSDAVSLCPPAPARRHCRAPSCTCCDSAHARLRQPPRAVSATGCSPYAHSAWGKCAKLPCDLLLFLQRSGLLGSVQCSV